jgi:hypothetical protein
MFSAIEICNYFLSNATTFLCNVATFELHVTKSNCVVQKVAVNTS